MINHNKGTYFYDCHKEVGSQIFYQFFGLMYIHLRKVLDFSCCGYPQNPLLCLQIIMKSGFFSGGGGGGVLNLKFMDTHIYLWWGWELVSLQVNRCHFVNFGDFPNWIFWGIKYNFNLKCKLKKKAFFSQITRLKCIHI